MFFCEPCRKKNSWPQSIGLSEGRCEFCGKPAVCYDVRSADLPPAAGTSTKRKLPSKRRHKKKRG